MKHIALSFLVLCPLMSGMPKATQNKQETMKFSLPLPKSYTMPKDIQRVALFLYKHAAGVLT